MASLLGKDRERAFTLGSFYHPNERQTAEQSRTKAAAGPAVRHAVAFLSHTPKHAHCNQIRGPAPVQGPQDSNTLETRAQFMTAQTLEQCLGLASLKGRIEWHFACPGGGRGGLTSPVTQPPLACARGAEVTPRPGGLLSDPLPTVLCPGCRKVLNNALCFHLSLVVFPPPGTTPQQ